MAFRDRTNEFIELRRSRNVFSTFSMDYEDYQTDTQQLLQEVKQSKVASRQFELDADSVQKSIVRIQSQSFFLLIITLYSVMSFSFPSASKMSSIIYSYLI